MPDLASIISVSLSSRVYCCPTYSIFALLVAKIGMFALMHTSVANWLLGDGSFTFWHSRRYGKSFQHINSLLYPTSCKNINLAWSVQTQGNLLFAELINAQKIISSCSNRNDLPQFSIPNIITLQNLPLQRASKFLKASAKTQEFMLFS